MTRLPSRWILPVALTASLAAGTGAEETSWRPVPLPGGGAGLCQAASLEPCPEGWRILYEVSRRLHPTYGDAADAARARERVRGHLQSAGARLPASISTPSEEVQMPLPLGVWRKVLGSLWAGEARLVEALLGDRSASLLYRGLFQLDEPTLRFLAGHADLLSWIREERAEAFSVFAGSLRVRGGHVDVPGGRAAEPLWQDVVGEPPGAPPKFLRRLLERDGAHQAFFYHALDHLSPAALRFALGSTVAEASLRGERFRALASAFTRTPAFWRPETGAFARPAVDPAVALALVKVDDAGRPTAPAGRAFWEAVFSSRVPAAGQAELLAHDTPFDAAWIAEQVGLAATDASRRERLTQLALGQRVFAEAAPAALPDVVFALRSLARYPALVLVLDRMDVRTPAVYAQAVRRAESLPASSGSRRQRVALAQFQGGLCLLDRARFSRTIGAAEAEELVASLSALPIVDERYSGAVAEWLETRLVPAYARAVAGEEGALGAEEEVIRALAGERAALPPPPFEWEGLWYCAAPGMAERERLRLVRERLGGSRLDAVLAFSRAARSLAEGPGSDALGRLREEAKKLDPDALPADARREMDAQGPVGVGRKRALVEAADEALAATLSSLAYAPHLGPPHGPALAGGSVASRHEFGNRPWALPEEILGSGPWRVRGSLLGLDVALARLSLRRLTGDMPARAPGLDQVTTLGLARGVAQRSPWALRDDEMTAIAEALARGRQRAAGARDGDELGALALAAGLDAWRMRGLAPSPQGAPSDASSFFTLRELLRLGGPEPSVGDGWGTPDLARGGSLRLLPAPRDGYDDTVGRRFEELHAARAADVVLRVAIELHSRHLPASLVPGVLSLFVQDLVQEATPLAHDDWLALARYAQQAPAERFDEYVSALAGEGPLVPAPEPGEPSTR